MLTLKDRLSHLNYPQACKLLGARAERLIMAGGTHDIDILLQTRLLEDRFELTLNRAVATITLDDAGENRLKIECSVCREPCEHQGAALSLLLEEKLALGLSAPPPDKTPIEALGPEDLIQRAIEDRTERARKEKMTISPAQEDLLWTDYIVTSGLTGKSYRVALRGWERGESYCSCPDFRKNTLGTCKHIIAVTGQVRDRFPREIKEQPYVQKDICCYLHYGPEIQIRMLVPDNLSREIQAVLAPVLDKPILDIQDLERRIQALDKLGQTVIVYPDAESHMENLRYQARVSEKVREIRSDPAGHPLRKTLLKTELLPYQLDGIAFAVGNGRCVIADDMGLGKTIQGVGVAQLLAQFADIAKVLVICPASLKSQWRLEIQRFSERTCQLVVGSAKERAEQYGGPAFFTVCNYEQVLRDLQDIEKVAWDLIILDEGQRIKNWQAKTSQTLKALKSRFALVLTGTPLENRLDELYSVVEFIDNRRLGPAFEFFNRYRVVDENGKILGYEHLDELKDRLQPILLRRTRKKVLGELPPRTTEIRRIPPTEEQSELWRAQQMIIQTILNKPYLTEMDLRRLQKALLLARMAANSTFLVNKQTPSYSTKLEELDELVGEFKDEEDRKVILFSEWTTMLDLIEPLLEKHGSGFVRLDGSVPQKKRQSLVHQFQNDPECKFFITTNAGSTGLNLQAANTVINVDLPWNPAILEQRIARAHRMGQENPVQVYLLVTEASIEETLLATLSVKHELSLAVLDPEANLDSVTLKTGIEDLKRRLEVLLGQAPDAPVDETQKEQVLQEAQSLLQKSRLWVLGTRLVGRTSEVVDHLMHARREIQNAGGVYRMFQKTLKEQVKADPAGGLKVTSAFGDFKIPGSRLIPAAVTARLPFLRR